jgi:xylulokinase
VSTFLGIDLGTTGLKVALLTEAGQFIGSEYCEYPILSPQAGYAEQDPEAWWTGFITTCQNLKSKYPSDFNEIAGIGICGQMHTQVYLDKEGQILRPAITWMDQRSSAIVDNINQNDDSKNLVFQETRNFATTTYTAPQVKWVKDYQPDVWSRVARILIAKDFIKFKLTGQIVTDYLDNVKLGWAAISALSLQAAAG